MATGVSPSADNRCGEEGDEHRPQEPPPNRLPRATRQPHRGGYDCEFVEPPPKVLQCDCPVCLLVLREPHQVTCCGYSFCATCVKRVQDNKKCCPTCNEADFTVFPDKRLKRSIYALNVYCCQRREGCEWEGELEELDRHLNLQPPPEKLLVGCQFAEVDCTYCVQPFQRRYVQAHQSDDCIKRPYTCQHCDKCAATFEEVTQDHWPVCPFFPISCPNNCELVLQRQEMEHHVNRDCPLTLVQCDFHMIGCQVQLIRRDMPSHISENLSVHMSLLQAHMMTHPGGNVATYLFLMVGSIQNLVMENANIFSELQQELQETRDELQQTCDELQQTRDELQDSQVKMAQLETTVASLKVTHAKEMQESREKIQAQKAILSQYQKTLEKVTCTGTLPFEFTMTEFEEHKRASDEWHSPPFYTHTHGYRVCITVYANGWGSGEGRHLSVHTYLMQGDFDDDLQWPFQGAITIQLLNQLEDSNHHIHTINFTGTTNSSIISKVTSGERAGRGWGEQKFISHTQLSLNTDRNCQYLKNNQLKFRVSKATNLDLTSHIHRRCLALESFAEAIEPHVCVVPIEFTLSDFEWQKKQCHAWHSPAFYTHPQGYRMHLEVHPNGWGSALGTHVSIFTYIMQGPFDGGLKWPFQGDITIQIVNQAGDSHHQEYTICYTDQSLDSTASKVKDKKRSCGRGILQFLSHSLLGYNLAMNIQYLKLNSLRIRILKVKRKN